MLDTIGGIYPDVKILDAITAVKYGTIVLIVTILVQNWQVVVDLVLLLTLLDFPPNLLSLMKQALTQ